jgi:predicted aspartyl protease
MSVAFDSTRPLIVVPATLSGPTSETVVKMAVDTGATKTVIRTAILASLGYDPATATEHVRAATASAIEVIPKIRVARFDALGHSRSGFEVLGHALPPSSQVDGLLGLDFLRLRKLTIDFENGLLTLS